MKNFFFSMACSPIVNTPCYHYKLNLKGCHAQKTKSEKNFYTSQFSVPPDVNNYSVTSGWIMKSTSPT